MNPYKSYVDIDSLSISSVRQTRMSSDKQSRSESDGGEAQIRPAPEAQARKGLPPAAVRNNSSLRIIMAILLTP